MSKMGGFGRAWCARLGHIDLARWCRVGLWAMGWAALLVAGWVSAAPVTGAAGTAGGTLLRVLLTSAESALDPAVASDLPSLSVNENLFDAPLRYDYLARPVRLIGNTCALPQISADRLTYTLRLTPGIHFAPDPAFGGAPRELVAQDYVYSIKRLYDPALKSPWLFMFEGKLQGDAALRATPFNIDAPVAGLQALDRYTLQIRLNAPEPNLGFYLATGATAALAREVVARYGAALGNHPVGTGPFRLGQWRRGQQLELLANRTYHGREAGQRLPRVDKVRVQIVEEPQARVLGFLSGQFDVLEQLPPQLAHMVLENGQLRPEWRQLQVQRTVPLQTYYMWMNLEDPVLGGYEPQKIALRRAIALAYPRAEDLQHNERGLAIAAQSMLPPNLIGHNPAFRGSQQYNPALANALLDKMGYRARDAAGFRLQPDGRNLTLVMHGLTSSEGRLRDEVWRRALGAIGLRVRFVSDKKAEIIKASRLGKVQMFETNWLADFPDAENFLQLLYGPNRGRANYARMDLPEYNRRYEQVRLLAPGPERQRLIDEMAQLVHGYAPWVLRMHPVSLDVLQPGVGNYQRHPVELTNWRYLTLAPR